MKKKSGSELARFELTGGDTFAQTVGHFVADLQGLTIFCMQRLLQAIGQMLDAHLAGMAADAFDFGPPAAVSGAWETLSIQNQQGKDVLVKQRQLDELGRVIALMGNAGQRTRVHYDKAGLPVRIEQQASHEPTGLLATVQQYDALARLTQTQDPAEGQTALQYGPDGQLSTVIAANQATTRYTRDGLGRLLQLDSPDTGIQIHYYDKTSQLSRTHYPAQPDRDIRYHYDALGRLTRIQYSDPQEDVTYRYDQQHKAHGAGIGRVTRITSRHSQIDYRYDRHGNLLSDSRIIKIDGKHTTSTSATHIPTATSSLRSSTPTARRFITTTRTADTARSHWKTRRPKPR